MLNFFSLPKSLQDKINPPKKLSPQEILKQALMTGSVYPVKYRNAAALSVAKSGAFAAPPLTNRGGKSADVDFFSDLPSFEALENTKIVPIGRGRFEVVRIPKPDKSFSKAISFIDWVTFSFKTHNFPLKLSSGHVALTDYDYVQALSSYLADVFGYGVTSQRSSGLNFFANSFDLGREGWGVVCIGGQNDSVSIMVKGQGLMAARVGWESRLVAFLRSIPDSKITRVDLASDNFDSKTTLNDYLDMYRADLFTSRGRPPSTSFGGDWERPNGKGRTLYIGSRDSGKLLRIYEKGLQLANGFHEKYPNWIRVELELSNKDRIIPFEVLTETGQYLAGAYPALANLHQRQERIATNKKTAVSSVERSVQTTRHQFGKHIWTHVQLFGIEKAFEMLTDGKDELPKNLIFDTHEQLYFSDFIHSLNPKTFQNTGAIPL